MHHWFLRVDLHPYSCCTWSGLQLAHKHWFLHNLQKQIQSSRCHRIIIMRFIFVFLSVFIPSVLCLSTTPIGQEDVTVPHDLPADVREALTTAIAGRTTAETAIKSWNEMLKRAPQWTESWASKVQSKLHKVYEELRREGQGNQSVISASCRESLSKSIEGVKHLDDWAIKRESFITIFSFLLFVLCVLILQS